MSYRLDEQARRLNEYLSGIGIRLTPERAQMAIQHAVTGVSDARAPEQQEIRENEVDSWAAIFGVTPQALLDAMDVAGRQVGTVNRYLRTGTPFQARSEQRGPSNNEGQQLVAHAAA